MNNYESLKLDVQNPEYINLVILAFILCVCLASIRRTNAQRILSKDQTNQLKGLAILAVILGHLWVHAVGNAPKLTYGGEAVAMFLILSGYGLTSSRGNRKIQHGAYIAARIKRVMIPYWIITVILVTLDYFLLGRLYNLQDIVMTMLGVNVNIQTRYIDYVRWFISFILIWYACYLLAASFLSDKISVLSLYGIAAVLFIADYYVLHMGFYQFAAFPVGCTLGLYYDQIEKSFSRIPIRYLVFAAFVLSGTVMQKIALSSVLYSSVPTIVGKALDEAIGILFCLSVITAFGTLGCIGYRSTMLGYLGIISYELFLLHGAFLVKYNPVIVRNETLLPYTFILFLLYIIVIAWLANRGIAAINAKN